METKEDGTTFRSHQLAHVTASSGISALKERLKQWHDQAYHRTVLKT